ncbi:MAG: toll/interleukin-1 receptor domain-containing protein [Chloroflexi bacterium]|nr:toll/interleukin-1 receptor domain-containing protein [Chloroflexota bacterium]
MPQVFLCYSRKDGEFARRLAADLDRLGADVWIDVDDIRSGDDWSDTIQRALDDCQVMVLILSPDAMCSANVSNEWKYFLDNYKPVIPVWFRPASIHFRLKPLQYVDFHNQLYEVAFKQLYCELQKKGMVLAPLSTLRDDATLPAVTVPFSWRTRLHRPRHHRSRRRVPLLVPIIGAVLMIVGVGGAALSFSAAALSSGDSTQPGKTSTPLGGIYTTSAENPPPATLGARIEATPAAAPDPDLRLVYDRYEFVLVNTSGAALDVSSLIFEQPLADGSARKFESNAWDQPGMVARPAVMPSGGCYQIRTSEARQVSPSAAICPKFLGYFSTGLPRRQFWIAAGDSDTFTVRQAGQSIPLAECSLSAGECSVTVP